MKVSIVNPKNLGEITHEADCDFTQLCSVVSTEFWSPSTFQDTKRTIKDFTETGLIVLDVDSGQDLETAKKTFSEYKHIIATTRNHQKEKNGVTCDRFRVVLFLDQPITNDRDFKATWARAKEAYPFIDSACKDASRFFYPSPGIESVNRDGRLFTVHHAKTLDNPPTQAHVTKIESGVKGELWKSTLDFLLNGAPAGHRHPALVKAVGNMREQGYTQDEVIDRVEQMTQFADWTQVGLNANDLKTIERMFERETKYPFQPKESEKIESGVIVSAAELLDETFEYLSDKDKVKGDPTGIEGLDKLLGGGFRTGELTVLMAQAKTGKNTLYHYMIYKMLERNQPFGYASRELNPATEVIPNLLSIAMKQNAWTSNLEPEYREKAQAILSQWQLFFAPGYGHFGVSEMETWFRALKDLGVNHFLFDHFHYALLTEDHESTATLIKKLKSLTKELDIHLSLIVQPRSLREGESLSLATLRGGSAIGQALDNLLILERVKGETNISRLTLEVARHKLAKLGDIHLMYDSNTTEFVEVDKRTVVVAGNEQAPRIPQGLQRNFPRVN